LILDPLTLNEVYDENLYDVGVLLQTEKALVLFEPGFRAWPHIYQSNNRSKLFYMRLETNLVADMVLLRTYKGRADEAKYENMLRTVLGLSGQGIIASLEFTMKDYLQQTRGKLRTVVREDWELEACRSMLCPICQKYHSPW
jgi:hypothetical protein